MIMKSMTTSRGGFAISVWASVVLALLATTALQAEAIETGFNLSPEEAVELAKNEPEVLFQKGIIRFYATVHDYKGLLHKQERIRGKLGKEQTVEFKFREAPYSIFMKWKKHPGKVNKMLYVKGKNDNMMLMHPTGLLSFIKSVKRDPRGEEVMKSSLKSCTEFGLLIVMKGILKECQPNNGRPKSTMEFVKEFQKDRRHFVLLEQTFENPGKDEAAKCMIAYDVELMAPTQREAYDSSGKLLYRYTYENLRFNTGLKDEDFAAKANGL